MRGAVLIVTAAACLVGSGPALGFSVFAPFGANPLEGAARWDARPSAPGLDDGVQVAIDPSVARELEVTEEDLPVLAQAIDAAFGMWENDALHFEIEHDSPLAQRDTELGAEIDVFAVPGSDPVWSGNTAFGIAYLSWDFVADRALTNGQTSPGLAITGVDLFLNATRLLETQREFGLPLSLSAFALTRLLAHEIGHGLGFGHPNENPSYDLDDDPLDAEIVDPNDPLAGLAESPFFDTGAIMSNRPCGPVLTPCAALFFQSLRPDDRLGRDVLYGVPEPLAALGNAAGLCALGVARLASSARCVRSRGSGAR